MAQQLLLSREQLAPIYAKLQATGSASTGQFQSEERAVGQESIAVGTTTDSYELRFPDELKVHSEVLAVGRDSTGTQVQIAYAVAGSSLQPVMVTRGYLYSIRVRFVALDRLGRVAASVDTTRHFVSPAPVPGSGPAWLTRSAGVAVARSKAKPFGDFTSSRNRSPRRTATPSRTVR